MKLEHLPGTKSNPIVATETGLGMLGVFLDEWRSNTFLHIRYFFPDKKTGDWAPMSKGVAIPRTRLPQVLEAICVALSMDDYQQEEQDFECRLKEAAALLDKFRPKQNKRKTG